MAVSSLRIEAEITANSIELLIKIFQMLQEMHLPQEKMSTSLRRKRLQVVAHKQGSHSTDLGEKSELRF